MEPLEGRIALAGDIAGIFGNHASIVVDINREPDEIETVSAAQLDDTLHVLAYRESGILNLSQTNSSDELSRTATISADSYGDNTTLTKVGDTLYFNVARIEDYGLQGEFYGRHELWATQGTAETTRSVASKLGSFSFEGEGSNYVDVSLNDHDGKLLATVYQVGCGLSCSTSASLWSGDESVERYSRFFGHRSDFVYSSGAEGIESLTRSGDDWYFLGSNEDDRGYALYKTNPLTRTTSKVKSLLPVGGTYGLLKLVDDSLYVELGLNGLDDFEPIPSERWKSDGTADGTLKLPEDHPDQALQLIGETSVPERGAIPPEIFVSEKMRIGNLLIVPASSHAPQAGLWVTDGTDERTKYLGDGLRVIGQFNEEAVVVENNSDLFVVDSNDFGMRPIGTLPNDASLGIDPKAVAATSNGLFFVNAGDNSLRKIGAESGETVVVLDSTDFAVQQIATTETDRSTLFVFGQNGFGAVNTSDNSFRLIRRGDWSGAMVGSSEDMLYIHSARSGVWVSDGTDEGTRAIARRIPSYGESRPTYVAEKVFVLSEARSLWVTTLDQQKQDLGVTDVSSMVAFQSKLYFLRNVVDYEAGMRTVELWYSDGSLEGTRQIMELPIDSEDLQLVPTNIVAVSDGLFFADGEGRLYKSDGTAKGTRVIREFLAEQPRTSRGPYSQLKSLVATDANRVFFTADDEIHGNEVWVTDGTTKGTQLAADIGRGKFGSKPTDLVFSNDELFFIADDGEHGREFWSIDTTETKLAGDANTNGSVGFDDFLILSAHFGKQTDQGAAAGDFDGDGEVSFTDFQLLVQNFGLSH